MTFVGIDDIFNHDFSHQSNSDEDKTNTYVVTEVYTTNYIIAAITRNRNHTQVGVQPSSQWYDISFVLHRELTGTIEGHSLAFRMITYAPQLFKNRLLVFLRLCMELTVHIGNKSDQRRSSI